MVMRDTILGCSLAVSLGLAGGVLLLRQRLLSEEATTKGVKTHRDDEEGGATDTSDHDSKSRISSNDKQKGRRRSMSRTLSTADPLCHDIEFDSCKKASKIAFIFVDYQPAYWEGQPAQKLFPHIPSRVQALLARCRQEVSPPQIIHVRANYSSRFAANFLRLNPGKTLPADVQPCDWAKSAVGETIISKPSFDGFTRGLQEHLSYVGIDHVVVCGLLTSVCVLFTCQSAFANGLKVTLFEDGCGDRDLDRHRKCIELFGNYVYDVENNIDALFDFGVDEPFDEPVLV